MMAAPIAETALMKRGGARWSRLPILLATALLGFAVLFVEIVRTTEPLALSPWESAIALEAMRAQAGLPLYEAAHATHMYGPLLTLTLAGVFSVTGLNLLAGRVVFCAIGIALAGLCAAICCRDVRRKYFALVFVLFLAIGWRTNFINFCAQPDAAAALLAIGGLVLWAQGRSLPRIALSLLLFVAAVFFKQTSAAFALVPIAHAVLFGKRAGFGRLARSGIPAAAVVISLVLVRFISPALFHGMIEVPASLTIHWERALPSTLFLLGSFPIVFLAWSIGPRRAALTAVETWSIAAAVVLVPLSLWTMLKSGGGYNSLFPAYLTLVAMVALKIDALISTESAMTGAIVAAALLGSFFFQIEKTLPLLFARSADPHYAAAVAVARQLGPGVISPQDPTIAYRANGSFGPALYFELDTHSVQGDWPRAVPENIATALRSARFVLRAESYVPVPQFDAALASFGFHEVPVPPLADSAYSVWQKE